MGEINGQRFPVKSIKREGTDEVEVSDVHVLHNNILSQPLTKILMINRINEQTGKEEKSSDATNLLEKETLQFMGNFNQNTDSHGIKFDEITGIITAADPLGRNLHKPAEVPALP